jgi:hypothetical protein
MASAKRKTVDTTHTALERECLVISVASLVVSNPLRATTEGVAAFAEEVRLTLGDPRRDHYADARDAVPDLSHDEALAWSERLLDGIVPGWRAVLEAA